MTLDLTDDETRALVQLLRRAIDEEHYFLAPRLDPLKAILAKLEPPKPQPEPLPPIVVNTLKEWRLACPRGPKYGLHSFRHAAASLFIDLGLLPKRIQTLMGHSTIGVTFDVYGHLFPSPDEDAAAMLRLQATLA